MGNCQNYGPFLGPLNWAPYYNRDPKRDHNFDSSPFSEYQYPGACACLLGACHGVHRRPACRGLAMRRSEAFKDSRSGLYTDYPGII